MAPGTRPGWIWTIGHSTRSWEDFLALLRLHGIKAIADVRRFPGSRRYPWFSSEAMAGVLPRTDIQYLWIPQLGGRRKARPGSPNGGWRNAAFQGYADHMASDEFKAGLAQLVALASSHRTAMLCAELLWWRCHRRLISDLLQHRGWTVLHILDESTPKSHPGNEAAIPRGEDLIYPLAQDAL